MARATLAFKNNYSLWVEKVIRGHHQRGQRDMESV